MWRGDSEGTVRCGEGTVRCGEGTENSIPCNNEICGKVRGFFSPFSSMEWPGLSVQVHLSAGIHLRHMATPKEVHLCIRNGNTTGTCVNTSYLPVQKWQHHKTWFFVL